MVYHAGFEAGFTMGRQAALKEAEERPGAQLRGVNKRRRVSVRRGAESRHFLLGLPCRTCGAYYSSDEKRCPVCKTQQRECSRPGVSACHQHTETGLLSGKSESRE